MKICIFIQNHCELLIFKLPARILTITDNYYYQGPFDRLMLTKILCFKTCYSKTT